MRSVSYFLSLCLFMRTNAIVPKNNVCHNWIDYSNDNRDTNPDCFFNPDMYMDTPELLLKYFEHYETHEIATSDGYFITTFRIPRKDPKGIILFRHPAISDSICWIGTGKESQAYFFWVRGYEIWMTNTRGTDFSPKHVNLTIDDYDFWNFSFHEIALYDLRAALKYIYHKSQKRRVTLIAHSMGSTEALVYASMFPTEAKKYAHVFALMGPTSSFKFSKIKELGNIITFLQKYLEKEKLGYLMKRGSLLARTVSSTCPSRPDLCIPLYSFFGAGWSVESNPADVPLALSQNPRAVSAKSIIHYGQIMKSEKFQMFDYGENNFQVYGSTDPPEYPISKILVPIYLIYSSPDNLAPEEDTEALYNILSESAKTYGKLKVDGMNHVDAIIGLHRKEKIYNKILDLINKF